MAQITYEQLLSFGACQGGKEKFRRDFGEAMKLTPEIAAQHATGYDIKMIVGRLLNKEQRKQYCRELVQAVRSGRFTGQSDPELQRFKAATAARIYANGS